MADSNLHINVALDAGGPAKAEIEAVVYGSVRDYGGSVSAEHGIGLLKRAYLGYSRSPEELAVMRRLKVALDPNGILNPTKVLG
jgi:FAD/FMN-containing dehydrogenase